MSPSVSSSPEPKRLSRVFSQLVAETQAQHVAFEYLVVLRSAPTANDSEQDIIVEEHDSRWPVRQHAGPATLGRPWMDMRQILAGLVVTICLLSGCGTGRAKPESTPQTSPPVPSAPVQGAPEPALSTAGGPGAPEPPDAHAVETPATGEQATTVLLAGAPSTLPRDSITTWVLPAGSIPLALFGEALVVKQELPSAHRVMALDQNGSVVWEHELRFDGALGGRALHWDISASGERLALHVYSSPVLILDVFGKVLHEIQPPEAEVGHLQFVDTDRFLLLVIEHDRSRVEPETFYLYDPSDPSRDPLLVDTGYMTRGAARAPLVATVSGRVVLFGLDKLRHEARESLTHPDLTNLLVSEDGSHVLVTGVPFFTQGALGWVALYDATGQLAWQKEVAEDVSPQARFAGPSGDVWILNADAAAKERGVLIRLRPDGSRAFQLELEGIAKNPRLWPGAPDGSAVVVVREAGGQCLVTAAGAVLACPPQGWIFAPDGTRVLEVDLPRVRLFQLPPW